MSLCTFDILLAIQRYRFGKRRGFSCVLSLSCKNNYGAGVQLDFFGNHHKKPTERRSHMSRLFAILLFVKNCGNAAAAYFSRTKHKLTLLLDLLFFRVLEPAGVVNLIMLGATANQIISERLGNLLFKLWNILIA